MPSYHEVMRRLRAGRSLEDVGHDLGVSPGLVYMLATGIPADGSDTLGPNELAIEPVLTTTQHLVGTPVANPTHKDVTRAWVRHRAATDPQMQGAAGRGFTHHTGRATNGSRPPGGTA